MTNLVVFEHNGEQISFDPEARMWNLNAMHKATGEDPNKAPNRWLRLEQTQELIRVILDDLNQFEEQLSMDDFKWDLKSHLKYEKDIIETRRGRYDSGTWVIQDLAIIYAHYLSPRFYLQWNKWAMQHLQQMVSNREFEYLQHCKAELEQIKYDKMSPDERNAYDYRSFFNECCEFMSGSTIRCVDFYKAYTNWATGRRKTVMPLRIFDQQKGNTLQIEKEAGEKVYWGAKFTQRGHDLLHS